MSMMSCIEPAQVRRLTVGQGDSLASNERDVIFTTVLGSCVAVCLYDSGACVGGMNHFLLADPAPLAGEDRHLDL